MIDLTKAQRMMVEDGAPEQVFALTPEQRSEAWKGRKLRQTKTFADPRPAKDEEPATKALRKELARAAMKEQAERLARLKETKASKIPAAKAATQESTMKNAKKSPRKAAAKPAGKPAPKKASKSRAAAQNARTPAAAKRDVVQEIADLMARPNGASMDELVKATGILAHPMRAKIKLVRDRLGYTTTAPGKDNDYRYHAQPPKKG